MTQLDEFTALRRYSRKQAACLLHIPDTWLKRWVTAHEVPHQRSGKPGPRQRGVWFTYDDIVQIGRMLPSLMSCREANSRAEGDSKLADAAPAAHLMGQDHGQAEAASDIVDDEFLRYLELASLRRV